MANSEGKSLSKPALPNHITVKSWKSNAAIWRSCLPMTMTYGKEMRLNQEGHTKEKINMMTITADSL